LKLNLRNWTAFSKLSSVLSGTPEKLSRLFGAFAPTRTAMAASLPAALSLSSSVIHVNDGKRWRKASWLRRISSRARLSVSSES
jgi:hypothetical protein